MKHVDIMEALIRAIEETIYEKWKHEGYICGWSSEYINCEIDNKEYLLKISEIEKGKVFSEYL